MTNLEKVCGKLGAEELFCEMAEEAIELIQEALNLRSAKNGKIPAPVSRKEVLANFKKEVQDVALSLLAIRIYREEGEVSPEQMEYYQRKAARWPARLEEEERRGRETETD